MKIDKKFLPIAKAIREFEEECKKYGSKPLKVCVERNDGYRHAFQLDILKDEKFDEKNYQLVERLIKASLWIYGGYKVYIGGCSYIGGRIKEEYRRGGRRGFDVDMMERVYEKPFEVAVTDISQVPDTHEFTQKRTFGLKGCRIGFDAGGSDRKVSAVIDGEVVYSEEVLWLPKVTSDPSYHYQEILKAFKTAASHMPRVDAIGVSSAGIYVNNQVKDASLFMSVPDDLFQKHVKNIYIDAAKQLGDVPLVVANDGDVTALTGALSFGKNKLLGIAMGTSEAAGYVDENGCIKGWLNELAFVPVDLNPEAAVDPWSGDVGVGVNYFSQDAVIKLASMCGIDLSAHDTPAMKLKAVQKMLEEGNPAAEDIFEDIGEYLAHTLSFYSVFYDIENVLILGRVSSGKGGEIMISKCNAVLKECYPELSEKITVYLPDEKSRRVGQSIAAASLPILD